MLVRSQYYETMKKKPLKTEYYYSEPSINYNNFMWNSIQNFKIQNHILCSHVPHL